MPTFTYSLFIPSCKSSPVPGISPSPSLTTTMARCGVYGHMSQHARLFQKPAPTLPKMLPALLGLWHLVKKLHGRGDLNGGLQVLLFFNGSSKGLHFYASPNLFLSQGYFQDCLKSIEMEVKDLFGNSFQ